MKEKTNCYRNILQSNKIWWVEGTELWLFPSIKDWRVYIMKQITSEMAGIVSSVLVEEGASIQIGQEVFIIESMKMQIPVESELAGIVKEIKVKPGDFINDGDVLLTCE